jgi:hypothetical protein
MPMKDVIYAPYEGNTVYMNDSEIRMFSQLIKIFQGKLGRFSATQCFTSRVMHIFLSTPSKLDWNTETEKTAWHFQLK